MSILRRIIDIVYRHSLSTAGWRLLQHVSTLILLTPHIFLISPTYFPCDLPFVFLNYIECQFSNYFFHLLSIFIAMWPTHDQFNIFNISTTIVILPIHVFCLFFSHLLVTPSIQRTKLLCNLKFNVQVLHPYIIEDILLRAEWHFFI